MFALPVAPLVAFAPSWWLIVAANLLLGANQGLAWSMTVVMKIDLAGPARRGLELAERVRRVPRRRRHRVRQRRASGMLVQAGALALLVAGGGAFASALAAAALLGLGTALVYPLLTDKRQHTALYRFWRDTGFVAGALLAGSVADALGSGTAIAIVAALTAASGLWRRPPAGLGRRTGVQPP